MTSRLAVHLTRRMHQVTPIDAKVVPARAIASASSLLRSRERARQGIVVAQQDRRSDKPRTPTRHPGTAHVRSPPRRPGSVDRPPSGCCIHAAEQSSPPPIQLPSLSNTSHLLASRVDTARLPLSRKCRSRHLFVLAESVRSANASGRSGSHRPLADDRVRRVQLTIRTTAGALAIAQMQVLAQPDPRGAE
jgi:hypothetical protein